MSATQPSPPRPSSEYSVRKQLDALSAGEIDTATFLRITLQRFRFDSEESWEVLSLLDQYHRLGKIKADAFREIKDRIGEYALSPREDAVVVPRSAAAAPSRGTASPANREPAPREAAQPDPSMPKDPPVREPVAAKEALAREPATVKETSVSRSPAVREPLLDAGIEQESSAKQPGARAATVEDALREIKVGELLRRRYRLEAVLGAGSMGTVFEASDPLRLDVPPNGQRLAIKVLHPAVVKRLELLQELRHEYQQLQSLSHPNIVRVYEFDRDGPVAFFTMELFSGISLARLLNARQMRPLPRPLAFGIIRDIASAIAYAHTRGIIHGDLNPQNIFVTTRGELRITNFGKSQRVGVSPVSAAEQPVTTSLAMPGFASCQVLEGDRPNAQDDIFALACLACLLLSGEHPYRDLSSIEARALRMRPRRPAGLRPRQWLALRAALHFDRKKRPADATAWIQRLDLREAAARLPTLGEMLESPAAAPHRFALLAGMTAALVAVAALVVASQNGWLSPAPNRAPRSSAGAVRQEAARPLPPAFDAGTERARAPTPAEQSPAPAAAPPAVVSTPAPTRSTLPPVEPAPATNSVATRAAAASRAAEQTAVPPQASPAAVPLGGARTRVEMAMDTVDVVPGEHAAEIMVRRKGSLRGETTFNWWTESGTAKPGTDFLAVVPHAEHMADGQSSVTLMVGVHDSLRAQPRSFYVVIDEAEGGASLTGRRLTMVTLN